MAKRTVQDMEAWNVARMNKRAELQAQKSREETYSFHPQARGWARAALAFLTNRTTASPGNFAAS